MTLILWLKDNKTNTLTIAWDKMLIGWYIW